MSDTTGPSGRLPKPAHESFAVLDPEYRKAFDNLVRDATRLIAVAGLEYDTNAQPDAMVAENSDGSLTVAMYLPVVVEIVVPPSKWHWSGENN